MIKYIPVFTMNTKPKFELESAIISAAARGYLLARSRGVEDILPGDALWEALEHRNFGPNQIVRSEEGRNFFMRVGQEVNKQVVKLSGVDPQG